MEGRKNTVGDGGFILELACKYFSIILPQNSKQGSFPSNKTILSKRLIDFELPKFGLQTQIPCKWFCLPEII